MSICVRDFTDHGNLPLAIKDGDPAQVRQQLAQGEVVLGAVLAHQIHAEVGDEITLDTSEGPKRLRVAATATVYLAGGKMIYMEGQTARRLLSADGVDMYVVNTVPGALADVEAKLKSLCGQRGMMVHSFADLRRHVDELMRGVIAGLWGLLALGLVVGAFGIANTLTMNVLEQTRELALLRVVAMTRWQVRKTILAQAVDHRRDRAGHGRGRRHCRLLRHQLDLGALAGLCPGVRAAPVADAGLLRTRLGGDPRRGLAPRRTRRTAESAHRLAVRVGADQDWNFLLRRRLFRNLAHFTQFVWLSRPGLGIFCRSVFESARVCRY